MMNRFAIWGLCWAAAACTSSKSEPQAPAGGASGQGAGGGSGSAGRSGVDGGGGLGGTAGSGGNAQGGGAPDDAGAAAGSRGESDAAAGGASDGGAASDGSGVQATGLTLMVPGGQLRLEVCTADIIRVAYAKDAAFFARPSLAAAPKKCVATPWQTTDSATDTTIATDRLKARVSKASGAVTFLDAAGQTILAERARSVTPATVSGEATSSVRQEWEPNADEALYGLGQHQQGLLDIKGYDLDFHQYNTEVFIPFFVSSRGYGILWDNTSLTRFGDTRPLEQLPVTGLYAANGDVAGATGTTVNWQGQVTAPATGDYQFQTYSSGDIKVTVNSQVVIEHWRQGWLPSTDIARVRLTAGQSYPVQLQWTSDISVHTLRFNWKTPTPQPSTSLWSEVADGIDYYFVGGPELDHVISGYRRITGDAPMMPRWAFGLWQCRERYTTQQESLDVLAGFRTRSIPIDNIVQDWQYWKPDSWGSHQFDATRFADPVAWIKAIHDTHHAHLMISVWPKFYTSTSNYAALNALGYTFKPNVTEGLKDFVNYGYTYYDAFNGDARQLFWSQVDRELFTKGVDAWWADGPEPDIVEGPPTSDAAHIEAVKTHMTPTALGTGARMLNGFSMQNSRAFYEGQRGKAPNQRVFVLTRNGFAGQQRYAAATWSGDVTSTWTALRKQLRAGLGFAASGMPYWTTDTGGFAVQLKWSAATPASADRDEWRELNTRWFQYSTFTPILRVHGQLPFREMYLFGETSPAYLAQLKFDRLRYRLLPYIYSLAGSVTHEGGTMMRPLVMDFRTDTTVRGIGDQYMFGPALLVSPVTTYLARTRAVVLPQTAGGWYDFWTGAALAGGQSVTAAAPFDAIPVHVRAGSIVPVGPEIQYTGEKPSDPITLYVYAGANGAFTLYEDDGTTYGYEQGAAMRIAISYDDATRVLHLAAREGTYPGMLALRTFNVVLVNKTKAVGFSFTPTADKTISYDGKAVDTTL